MRMDCLLSGVSQPRLARSAKSIRGTVALSALAAMATGGPALGGPFDGRPKILLRVTPVTTKNMCAAGQIGDCMNAITAGSVVESPGGPYHFAYMLAARGNLASSPGFGCGITYDGDDPDGDSNGRGVDVFEWRGCGDGPQLNSFPLVWPKPGSYFTRYWYGDPDDCNSEEAPVVGYFYLGAYSPDTLRVIGRGPSQPGFFRCGSDQVVTLNESDLGWATFSAGSTSSGCNPCVGPCLKTATFPSTWSRIKTLLWEGR